MIIGITGVMGSGKGKVIEMFKEAIPNNLKHSFFYADIDEKIGNLLHIDTPTYNQLKENLGENWEKYQDKGIGHHYRCNKLLRQPDDYLTFMNTMRPYVTCKIAKITGHFYNQKDIIIYCNHLLDYEWASFCDRIVVIDCPEEIVLRRLKKKGVWNPDTAKEVLSKFLTNDELVEKADFVIHHAEPDVMKKEIKKMVKQLLYFRQCLKNGMIPSSVKETVEKNQKIIDDCYATYAPQFAAAMAAKLIANQYGYDTGTSFTGYLENHRDIVGGPLEEGELSHLTIRGREKRKRRQEIRAKNRELGLPTPEQVKAEERKRKEEARKRMEEKKKQEEEKLRLEHKKEKEREKQKRRRQKKAAEKYGETPKTVSNVPSNAPIAPAKKKTIIICKSGNTINGTSTKKPQKPIDKK